MVAEVAEAGRREGVAEVARHHVRVGRVLSRVFYYNIILHLFIIIYLSLVSLPAPGSPSATAAASSPPPKCRGACPFCMSMNDSKLLVKSANHQK